MERIELKVQIKFLWVVGNAKEIMTIFLWNSKDLILIKAVNSHD